ncbi:MAG: hypothetical protein OEY89_12825 [Gammaproteobacteria bacterium]|nr:hypothetical protein [Gammaproteobacteria bacterium]
MSDLSYSSMLRTLCDDYYHKNITQHQYRAQRKKILDSIDSEFNHINNESPVQDEDTLLMRTISFFKNKDIS